MAAYAAALPLLPGIVILRPCPDLHGYGLVLIIVQARLGEPPKEAIGRGGVHGSQMQEGSVVDVWAAACLHGKARLEKARAAGWQMCRPTKWKRNCSAGR